MIVFTTLPVTWAGNCDTQRVRKHGFTSSPLLPPLRRSGATQLKRQAWSTIVTYLQQDIFLTQCRICAHVDPAAQGEVGMRRTGWPQEGQSQGQGGLTREGARERESRGEKRRAFYNGFVKFYAVRKISLREYLRCRPT